MTKIQVFIDFEAISAPFSYKLKIENDTPYAYSIGVHKGKKFTTRTTIINFNNVSQNDIFEYIRMDITQKIREIISNKEFKVNKDSIQFIGWAPNLEKKILSKSFKGVEVIDQTKGESISLATLTNENFDNIEYFPEFKKEIIKKLDSDFIERRGLSQDGAIAALAGYELFRNARNIKGKYNIDFDIRTLVKEIVKYSEDDIVRMSFLYKNQSIFNERKIVLIEKNSKKQKISRRINKLANIVNLLNHLDPESTIESAIKKISSEIELLKKDKDNL